MACYREADPTHWVVSVRRVHGFGKFIDPDSSHLGWERDLHGDMPGRTPGLMLQGWQYDESPLID